MRGTGDLTEPRGVTGRVVYHVESTRYMSRSLVNCIKANRWWCRIKSYVNFPSYLRNATK